MYCSYGLHIELLKDTMMASVCCKTISRQGKGSEGDMDETICRELIVVLG